MLSIQCRFQAGASRHREMSSYTILVLGHNDHEPSLRRRYSRIAYVEGD